MAERKTGATTLRPCLKPLNAWAISLGTTVGWGAAGVALMIGLGVYLVVPSLFGSYTIGTETLFLFMAWSVLGLLFFRRLVRRDPQRRFGNAMFAWVVFLSLLLFVSMVWMKQYDARVTAAGFARIREYYARFGGVTGDDGAFIQEQLGIIQSAEQRGAVIVMLVFALSLFVLSSNYAVMSKRALTSEAALGAAKSIANTDSLTGVKSKHAYMEAESRMDAKIRIGSGPFAVAVCDVNGLKHVNDTLGHKAGDSYILASCRLICEAFKHSPVYRIGGDEFVVILEGPDFDNRDAILRDFNARVEENIGMGRAVVSAGLAVFDREKNDRCHTVFERADGLMYARKKELKSMGSVTREQEITEGGQANARTGTERTAR